MDQRTLMSLGMMVMLIVFMYFILIRPQKKKEKQLQQMRNSLQAGDNIVTIGGILGKVVKIKNDSIVIAVGQEKTKLEVTRWAISSVLKSKQEQEKPSKPKALKKDEEVVEAELEEVAKDQKDTEVVEVSQTEATEDKEVLAEATEESEK